MKLDDQLAVRMKSSSRAAIKEAATEANISEGEVIRYLIETAEENGELVPYWFLYKYQESKKQESDRS